MTTGSDPSESLQAVTATVCLLCLDGAVGECHSRGGVFFLHDGPAPSSRGATFRQLLTGAGTVEPAPVMLPPGMDNYQQAAAQALAKKGKQLIDEETVVWEPVQVLSGAATILLADAMRRSDELATAAAQLEAELHLIRAAAPEPATVVTSEPEVEAHLPVEPGTNRRHSWTSFREAGMLWCVNRVLHMFGWAIVIEVDDATGATSGAFPVRTEWRGFPRDREDIGYERTSAWLEKAGAAIREETDRK